MVPVLEINVNYSKYIYISRVVRAVFVWSLNLHLPLQLIHTKTNVVSLILVHRRYLQLWTCICP